MASPNGAKITLMLMVVALTLATGEESSQASPAKSFYDVLSARGLPTGLFPKGISNFSVDPATGRFELNLMYPYPCDAKYETRVRYDCNITGVVGYGKIANLSGVAAQELFLWLPVKGIQVDIPSSGLIYFDVGVVFKQFSLSFFETPKNCDAMEMGDGGGRNDFVVFEDGRARILERQSGKSVFTDHERRAVS